MRARWAPENSSGVKGADAAMRPGKVQDYVLERYFVKSDQSRALLRNGIARLWWYSYLTYDADREDPFELTAVLLRTLDIAQHFLERNFGRNTNVLRAILEFIVKRTD